VATSDVPPFSLLGDRGGEEVVRLVPGLLRGPEPIARTSSGSRSSLLEQLGIEDAARLVGGNASLRYVGSPTQSQPTSTARGSSDCQRRRRKFANPTIAPDGRPVALRIDLGRAW
jgi:hypothetical protein